jgi:thioredoxin-related protein
MKFRPQLILILLLLAMAFPDFAQGYWGPVSLAMPQGLNQLNYNEALTKAAKENKSVLVYFWADWCPSCRAFNEGTLPQKSVLKALADSYAVVSVNLTSDPEKLAKKYEIRAIPAFVFLNSQGEPISMLPGAVDPDIFVLVLNFISSGSYATMDFEEFAKLKTSTNR